MNFVRFFIYIVAGALAASIIGGVFACIVAMVSPEFVASLFARPANGAIMRYAAGVGMIWGIFLGTAAMAFSLLLTTLIHVARLIKKKSEESEISNR